MGPKKPVGGLKRCELFKKRGYVDELKISKATEKGNTI